MTFYLSITFFLKDSSLLINAILILLSYSLKKEIMYIFKGELLSQYYKLLNYISSEMYYQKD